MKKKSIILISVISSILLGIGIAAFVVLNDTFSFSNLNVDIGDSSGLGIGKIANDNQTPNGRKYQSDSNSQTESNYDKLVKVDDEGNVEIVRFYNTEGDTIEVPFHAILIENYGDFSYVVFSNWSLEYQEKVLSNFSSIQMRHTFHSYFSKASIIKSAPITEFGMRNFEYEFVAIHKNTGKVFDLGESIINNTQLESGNYLRILYLPNGFAYTTAYNNGDCVNRGLFNDLNSLIEVTVICSPLLKNFRDNQIALPNGDTYMGDGKVFNLYDFNLSDSSGYERFLKEGFIPLFISTSKIIWMDSGTNIIKNLDFNENGNFVDFSENEDINFREDLRFFYRNPYSAAPFLYLDYSEILGQNIISINEFNAKTGESNLKVEININDLMGEFVHFEYIDMFSFNNSMFLILWGSDKTEIIELNSTDFSLIDYSKVEHEGNSTTYHSEIVKNPNYFLFGQEFYQSNDLITFIRTGNLYYSIIENLTIKNFKYNIYTNEVYEESESTPVFSYFEITPIN